MARRVEPKTVKDLIRLLQKMGIKPEMTKKGHWKIPCPNGELVTVSGTAGHRSAMRSACADLRRRGVEI